MHPSSFLMVWCLKVGCLGAKKAARSFLNRFAQSKLKPIAKYFYTVVIFVFLLCAALIF